MSRPELIGDDEPPGALLPSHRLTGAWRRGGSIELQIAYQEVSSLRP